MDDAQRVGLMVIGSTMILASGDPYRWTWTGGIGLVLFLVGFYYSGGRDENQAS